MDNTTERSTFVTALTLGVVAGLRSQLPLALLGWRLREQEQVAGDEAEPLPAVMKKPWFIPLVTTFAAGELIGDKLPFTPSRLEPAPLVGRLLLGGLAGVITAKASRESSVVGALAGASGAVVGAFGGYHVRKAVVQASRVADPIVAIGEDVVAIGAGVWAAHRLPGRVPETGETFVIDR